jgi:hypothetical protein
MNDLHCVLVLLVDTVLVSVLHMLMQDLVEGVGFDRIEQLLEVELLFSNGVREAIALLARGCRDNRQTKEGEDEYREEEVLNP